MYKDSWALKGTFECTAHWKHSSCSRTIWSIEIFPLGPFNELKVLGPLLLGVLTEEMPLTRSCGFNLNFTKCEYFHVEMLECPQVEKWSNPVADVWEVTLSVESFTPIPSFKVCFIYSLLWAVVLGAHDLEFRVHVLSLDVELAV
jgi:hypothetical protein